MLIRNYVHGNKRVNAQLALLRDAVAPSVERVLVIGCGSGESAHYIAARIAKHAKIVGVDISPEAVRIARKLFPHRRIEYRCENAVAGPIENNWDVIVLPDVYEHIPAGDRNKLHANLKVMLAERGKVLLTLPSPGHQTALHEQGWGLQIVDETVTLNDLLILADDLDAPLVHYSWISAFQTNDYVHAVIEREADRVGLITPADRILLKRQKKLPNQFIRLCLNQLARPGKIWRQRRVMRLLGSTCLRHALAPPENLSPPDQKEKLE